MVTLDRITSNPNVMTGKPCIRGMRITVLTVLGLLAAGMTKEEITDAYPYLEFEDIEQCLNYYAQFPKKIPNTFTKRLSIDAANRLQERIKQSRDE
jgi:uncharacterized protein (DUF433 family)